MFQKTLCLGLWLTYFSYVIVSFRRDLQWELCRSCREFQDNDESEMLVSREHTLEIPAMDKGHKYVTCVTYGKFLQYNSKLDTLTRLRLGFLASFAAKTCMITEWQ